MPTVYEIITDRITTLLDQGVVPWRTPWVSQRPMNLVTKTPYKGVNVFLLGAMRYPSPYWLTLKQCKDKGGRVKEDEFKKSSLVVFSAPKGQNKGAAAPPKGQRTQWITRFYQVWNVSQCEGLEVPETPTQEHNPIEECAAVADGYFSRGPKLYYGGDRACYIPALDTIHMPNKDAFHTSEEFYSTLFHECGHSTGAESRLKRVGVTDPIKFASHNYSYEELVAEMCAAFLCGHTGILDMTIENSAAYIASWRAKLKSDPMWVVKAGSAAEKASKYILGDMPAEQYDLGEE